MIKTGKRRRAEHVACMRDMRITYEIVVGRPETKDFLKM
jgi:hypothetical protein